MPFIYAHSQIAIVRVFLLNLQPLSLYLNYLMSQFCIYVKVPPYLDQWLRHDFWNPSAARVEFERGSNAHSILSRYLRKRPKDYEPGDTEGLLPIEVPTFKGLNPASHNYLIHEGHKALVSALKRNFKSMLDRELSVFYTQDVVITDIIYAFMAVHGIDNTEQNWETIRQMFYRLRDKSIKSASVKQS